MRMASQLIFKQRINRYIDVSVTCTLVPAISYMKASPHESSYEIIPQSLSMSLDFYAIKLNESFTVSLSLWSFPDLSLTAWEPPAKTSNEILALTVVTGEGWKVLFPHRFSFFLASLRAPSEDLPPFTLAGSCSISSLLPLFFPPLLRCSALSLSLSPPSLSLLSPWFSVGPLSSHHLSLLLCDCTLHQCVCGWRTKVKLPPWLHMPTAGIWVQRRLSKFSVMHRKQNIQ